MFTLSPGRRLQSIILLGMIVLLGGCTTMSLPPESSAKINSIGVLSLLPAELRYEKIGITVFNNERLSRPAGAVLNEASIAAAKSTLAPNRKVTQIADVSGDLSARFYSRSLVMSAYTERIQNELAQFAKQFNLDAILVIAEEFDSDRGRRGVQVFFRAGFGNIQQAVLRPDLVMYVVDQNGKALVRNISFDMGIPISRADGKPWSYELADNISNEQHTQLLSDMAKAISSTVTSRINAIGFK